MAMNAPTTPNPSSGTEPTATATATATPAPTGAIGPVVHTRQISVVIRARELKWSSQACGKAEGQPRCVMLTTAMRRKFCKDYFFSMRKKNKFITDREDTAALRRAAMGNNVSQQDVGVIFLDCDGVINRTPTRKQFEVEPELCQRLRRIVDDGGASIVLSTF
mmetsp:Transcript_106179/g.307259  ORF Transcript_106179/g.307259 Transcript_106179/m.307259 type:complete len:163 (+) Transcript_106179:2262-2750(+)